MPICKARVLISCATSVQTGNADAKPESVPLENVSISLPLRQKMPEDTAESRDCVAPLSYYIEETAKLHENLHLRFRAHM